MLLLVAASDLGAQPDSAARLEAVVVTVTRVSGRSVLESPFALTVVRPDSARPGQRHTSVDETLAMIPGLSATSRNNPSQDPRLSIRGFGARSAFGVRGVRVLRDGMPLTLPDGQTPLDYLSLESVGRIEVMRGSASALYGNASGGVVDIRSIDPAESPLTLGIRQWIGGDNFWRSAVAASGSASRLGWVADAGHTRGDGMRRHSQQRATSGFARGTYETSSARYALNLLALDNPLSENPGALTLEEMRADARAADPSSVRRNARKHVEQIQVGATAEYDVPRGQLTMSAYGGARSLDNPLTFAIVDIGRRTWGASAAFRNAVKSGGARHAFVAGLDLQSQNDVRRNFATCADTVIASAPTALCPDVDNDRGVVTLDQRELVSSVGAYVSGDIRVSTRVIATIGARTDRVRFRVRDRLVTAGNPDDSGNRDLNALSPLAGIVARITPLVSVYGNISSAFETPTATELGNQPDGAAGINQSLDPQRSITVEGGTKGFFGSLLSFDLAFYSTSVRDELVPFEIQESNGRRYFRNAGRTSRRGAEAGATIKSGSVSLMASYALTSFRFREYTSGDIDFSGMEIPGIPRHRAQLAATLVSGSLFGVVESELAGPSFADDANTVSAPGYSVFHLRGGVTPLRRDRRFAVIVGIQNILDRTYASSIAVNAARLRYFEPAVKRALSVGLSIGFPVVR